MATTQEVITYRNVYTGRTATLCDAHRDTIGDGQVQHGDHRGVCDVCRSYTVTAPTVPGGVPTVQATVTTLQDARTIAARFDGRADLRYHDVIIRRGDKRVEYAGPAR